MNLEFGDFAGVFREVKENHPELRRASALLVRSEQRRKSLENNESPYQKNRQTSFCSISR